MHGISSSSIRRSRSTNAGITFEKCGTSVQKRMKSLDPLRAKKTFIRKKLGHTAVSAIKASSVTL